MDRKPNEPKVTAVERYNDEATQVYLRALDGCDSNYRRFENARSLADVVSATVNDNHSH